MDLLNEMSSFSEELMEYSWFVTKFLEDDNLADDKKTRAVELMELLTEKVGYLGEEVIKLSGLSSTVAIQGKEFEIWSVALASPVTYSNASGLNICIHTTKRALGRLKAEIKNGLRNERGNIITKDVIQEKKERVVQNDDLPNVLFKQLKFHPKIVEVSRKLFLDGHYAQAILEACKAVELSVKEKSGLNEIGKNLMAQAFNEQRPLIRVLESEQYLEEVQEGFKFLFMGTMLAIRNPKAHLNIVQKDPYITLEYLGLVSFLLKRIDSFHVQKE